MVRAQVAGAMPSEFAPRLVIMAKRPVAGAVKRRLSRGIGTAEALRFYRAALRHTVLRLGADPRWHTILAVSPDTALADTCWPAYPRLARMPQGRGDLGARMQSLFDLLPPGPTIIVGSDIPAIRPAHIAYAFKQLGDADAVFGPAQDGGFWLVGFKRRPRRLAPFQDVPWSTDVTLAATVQNLRGCIVAYAATLGDVDRKEDYCNQRDCAARVVMRCAATRGLRA